MTTIQNGTVGDLLVDVMSDQQVWADLTEAFNAVDSLNVAAPVKALEQIRFLFPNADPEILYGVVRMLGFDVHKDLLSVNADNLTKLATQLSKYADVNGTTDFIHFIDLLCSAQSTVTYLYTKDYVNFHSTPGGPMIHEGGPWFATTHIDVMMMMFGLETMVLAGDGLNLAKRAQLIFEKFQPAELVIRNFGIGVIIDDPQWIGAQGAFGIALKLTTGAKEVTIGGYR